MQPAKKKACADGMIVLAALVGCGALIVLIAALALATKGPSSPVAPSVPRPPKQGSSLPASCKITGNVFGSNARVKGGVGKQNVRATYHYYAPDYNTSSLACADAIWKWPNYQAKILTYPWTAYCLEGPAAWNPSKMCGGCLRVKNRATGASIIVRVVDSGGCSGGSQNGLDLDPCAFNAIDTDKSGVRDGHVMVDVEEVVC